MNPNIEPGSHEVHAGVRFLATIMLVSPVVIAAVRFSGWLAFAIFAAYSLGFVNAGVVDVARRRCDKCRAPGEEIPPAPKKKK